MTRADCENAAENLRNLSPVRLYASCLCAASVGFQVIEAKRTRQAEKGSDVNAIRRVYSSECQGECLLPSSRSYVSGGAEDCRQGDVKADGQYHCTQCRRSQDARLRRQKVAAAF